jgi:hypothetical protein
MTYRMCEDCMTMLKNEDKINENYGVFQPCKCAELENNILMWSILTYGAGFINWWIYSNECGYCQSHANILLSDDNYQNHIVDIQTLYTMIKDNPNLLVDKNSNGDTILTIIDDIIRFIYDTIKTYETPNKRANEMTNEIANEIIIGKKHISELTELRKYITGHAMSPDA